MKDRLKSEFGLVASLTKLRVALKESVRGGTVIKKRIEKKLRDGIKFVELDLEMEPLDPEEIVQKDIRDGNEVLEIVDRTLIYYLPDNNILEFGFFNSDMSVAFFKEFRESKKVKDQDKGRVRNIEELGMPVDVKIGDITESTYRLGSAHFELLWALEQMIIPSFKRGPLLGKPLINTRVKVVGGLWHKQKTNEVVINIASNLAMMEGLQQCSVNLMEPVVSIEVNCPEYCSQDIINDLISQRNGKISDVTSYMTHKKTADNVRTIIKGTISLYKTIGYSTYLRTLSHGEASFLTELKGFQAVADDKISEFVSSEK